MNFPVEDLAKRATEFQVAENVQNQIVGAVGLQIAQKQGRIHSEGFTDFALADQLRPMIWERLQSVATNHGLLRLWSQEKAPFWSHCGLGKSDAESLQKLPMLWRDLKSDWLTLKLKDDIETIISLDKEFALFKESEKQRTARAFQHAKLLKLLATLIASAVLVLVLVGAFYLIKKNPHLLGR